LCRLLEQRGSYCMGLPATRAARIKAGQPTAHALPRLRCWSIAFASAGNVG
jgi:hypothetical protein